MTKKEKIAILFLLFISYSYSQKKITSFKNSLKTSTSKVLSTIPVVDKKTNEINLFITDKENIYGYKLNEFFEVEKMISSKNLSNKYKKFIGSSINKNKEPIIFLANKNKNKFLKIKFSFEHKTIESEEFQLKNNKEKFIESVSTNNNFYLISSNPLLNGFNIYTFDDHGNYTKNKIEISDRFISKLGQKILLGKLLTSKKKIIKIEETVESSIKTTSKKTKMYVREDHLIFSFDNNSDFTQTLKINLKDLTTNVYRFQKPLKLEKRKMSNSFINDDKIFLLSSTNDILKIFISDFEDGKILKEYKIENDKPITFKNSPIIEEIEEVVEIAEKKYDFREHEKTKKFLKKVNNDNMGISVRKFDNKNQITIGSYSQESQNIVIPNTSSVGNPLLFVHGTHTNIYGFKNNSIIRIECLFDKDFNSIRGHIGGNIFDKMIIFKPRENQGLIIFKYQDYFIRGYYDDFDNTYVLEKFEY